MHALHLIKSKPFLSSNVNFQIAQFMIINSFNSLLLIDTGSNKQFLSTRVHVVDAIVFLFFVFVFHSFSFFLSVLNISTAYQENDQHLRREPVI